MRKFHAIKVLFMQIFEGFLAIETADFLHVDKKK